LSISFTELELPLSVKSTRADPISTFFVPVLRRAECYDVAVGFFTTAWVKDAAEGIAQFACNGGQARWIISPIISAEDYLALRDAAGTVDEQKLDELASRSFEELFKALQEDTRAVLACLIGDRIIQFRVAVPTNELTGMMHAKMGVFRDSQGNQIGFSGSYNLTSGAATNWETIEVYCSWRSQEASERIQEICADFVDMWNGNDPNLVVFQPSEKALEPFIQEAERTPRPYVIRKNPNSNITVPAHFLQDGGLRGYQQEAIRAWFKNNGQGVLSMATGSGKTVTALAAATRLVNHALHKSSKLLLVVAVPYQHLADQWAADAIDFGFEPVVCFGGAKKWSTQAQQRITELSAGTANVVMLVTVNNTFASPLFQKLIAFDQKNILLIADEVHNLGAKTYRRALPENIRFRLGLSATPIRHGDEEGTKALEMYFGKTVFEFSLKDAIEQGHLCRYYYHPVLAPLNSNEMIEYKDLSARIAKAYAIEGADSDGPNEGLKKLLIARARLIARVESKTVLLEELLEVRSDSAYNLIYCGDARDSDDRQVNKVLRLVGQHIGMRASKFTAEESALERRLLLERFTRGELQTLIAIRCLDEGVDVPRTETAYILASSTNPRQYIQRRGRVLRRAPGKDTATIYDFIAVPDLDELARTHPDALETERGLLRRELVRVNEFAELALNPGEALERLREVKKRLHLMDI
jgi:DNA phosphorothioation system restriction enzyme